MTVDQTDAATNDSDEQDPFKTLRQFWTHPNQLRALAISTAIRVGVIDTVHEGPKTAAEIAVECELAPNYVHRLLRALTAYGLFTRTDDHYSLTPVSKPLLAEHPSSFREIFLFYYSPDRLAACRHMPEVVARGDISGYELEYGCTQFEYFEQNPEFGETFHIGQDSDDAAEGFVQAMENIDLSECATVCDVGGGYGGVLCRLLDIHPHLEGTLFDLPSVLADEQRLWGSKLGVEDRCRYVAGDMFEKVPHADAYILKAILHDWPDDDCMTVLSNIHDAAADDARLFVGDFVIPEEDPPPEVVDMDLWMMVETGGRERTRSEFESLFERTGWSIDQIIPQPAPASLITCTKGH